MVPFCAALGQAAGSAMRPVAGLHFNLWSNTFPALGRRRTYVKHYLQILMLLVFAAGSRDTSSGAALSPVLKSWLAAQTNMQTWAAEVVQTRTLKSLSQPLTATGHVWFAAPNRFRWELGSPAQTIAVRATQELLVIYPRLKRVERFPLSGQQSGPWRDALALLEAGFPRSEAEMEKQYNIVSEKSRGSTCELVMQPKSAAARRMIPQIRIDFDTRNFSLVGTELQFADGSTMRNDFKNEVLNPPIDEKLLSPDIPKDTRLSSRSKNRLWTRI